MYKGWKMLTKDEREHLRVTAKCYTTYDLEKNFRGQAEMRHPTTAGHTWEPCWDCRMIARKLGYPLYRHLQELEAIRTDLEGLPAGLEKEGN
jgi:hypothetical protein